MPELFPWTFYLPAYSICKAESMYFSACVQFSLNVAVQTKAPFTEDQSFLDELYYLEGHAQ